MSGGTYLEVLTYDGERLHPFGPLVSDWVVQELLHRGAPGCTVVHGVYGLDRRGTIQDVASEYANENLPVCIQVFASTNWVGTFLQSIDAKWSTRCRLFTSPAVDVRVCTDHELQDVLEMSDHVFCKVYLGQPDVALSLSEWLGALRGPSVAPPMLTRARRGFGSHRAVRKPRLFSNRDDVWILEAMWSRADAMSVLDEVRPRLRRVSGPAVILPVAVWHPRTSGVQP
ncbi:MAG: DUF190 domain-containing protein [Alicyclobacillus sp.]|nr:DUF190 domain-containing protein [Alicyclobacillus sp.]